MSEGPAVLIAGAGATGLALACGLLAGGATVRILDRAPGPAVTSRALGLQPRGSEVLDRLGALDDLPDRSVAINQVAVHLNGRQTASLRLGQRTKLVTRPGLLVSQAEIEAALRTRLGELGGAVEWGHDVTSAEQDADGVVVDFQITSPGAPARSYDEPGSSSEPDTGGIGGEPAGTVRCAWLVGCDGAHSQIRKVSGTGFPGVPLVERFLLADVHADLPGPRDTVSVWLRGDQMIAAFPLPGADVWRLMAPVEPLPEAGEPARSADAAATTGSVIETLTRLLQEHSGVPASAVRDAVWTSTFRVHRRLAESYRTGRILLAGDAAHIHSPIGGQGLNTGLGDAENLAWKLALVTRGRADPTLLDTYQAERRPIATEVLDSTSTMTRMVLGDSLIARLVRDRVFVPLLDRPVVRRFIWEQASQLKVSYRRGPLASSAARRAPGLMGDRPRSGDRMPDVECRRTDGGQTRLHAELGGRWVLLVPPAGAIPAVDVVVAHLGEDAVTALERVDRRQRHAVLVRPDGHVGCAGSPGALDGWLRNVLQTGRS